MILILAVAAGLISGWLRATWHKRRLNSPNLKWIGLVILAFLPQLFAFQLTHGQIVHSFLGIACPY